MLSSDSTRAALERRPQGGRVAGRAARARRRAVRRARLPHRPRRGVAVHERRAARRDRLRSRPSRVGPAERRSRVQRTPTRRCGWCSSTAASPRRCRARRGCPPASRCGSLAAALNDHADVVAALPRPARATSSDAQLHGAQHRVRRRTARSSTCPDGVVLETPIHVAVRVGRRRRRTVDGAPADAGRRRREQRRRASSRATSASAARPTSPTPSRRSFVGENAGVDHYKVQQESLDAFHIAQPARAHRAQRDVLVALVRARRHARPQRRRSPCSTAKAATARSTACISADRERLIDNHTTIDHAQAALRQPRGLQGHPRRHGRARSSTARSSSGQDAQKTDAKQTNRRCCCPTARRSTPSRSSRSSPTT